MNEFMKQFDSVGWKDIIDLVERKRLKITKNSILLSRKIYNDTGYMVYPVIFRTYAGRNMLRAGAFSWTMYMKNGKEIGSIDRVSECLRNDVKLFVNTSWKDIEIIAEKVKKNEYTKRNRRSL